MAESPDTRNVKQQYSKRKGQGNDLPTVAFGKKPPQAIDLEEVVLGALMLERDAVSTAIDILKPESFYKPAHQEIYKAILTLFNETEPIDVLTVVEQLKKDGTLEEVGGAFYVSELTNRVASAANVEYHARIISQKYILRELIKVSSEVIKDAYDDTIDVFDMLNKAESGFFSITDENLRRMYDGMDNLVPKAIEQIAAARDHQESLTGVPTGFTELDRLTSGWQKSDLIIVAARPGMGKTAFTLSIARNASVDHDKPVAVFSLEMSNLQLVTRLISAEAELPAEKLRRGNLEPYEWQQLVTKSDSLNKAKIFIDDTPAINVFELRAKCRRLKMQHDVQLFVIDYLQLMSGTGDNKGGNREQEISTISRALKSIAKELNTPVIALSQLSRAVETRGGTKKPQLSDLRESGAIEQDADLVIFLYRPEYYGFMEDENNNSTQGLAEIIVAKHRNGALKSVFTRFIDKYAKFAELEQEYMGEEGPVNPDAPPAGGNDSFMTRGSRMNEGGGGFGGPPEGGDEPPF